MVTEPMVRCLACGGERRCLLHQRAEFPPEAAKDWLRRGCENRERCEFSYRVGCFPSGVATKQQLSFVPGAG